MEHKVVTAAKKAKADGFTHMYSVVKSHYNSTYCHVNRIDDIITAGKWIPAPINTFGWSGRIGTRFEKMPGITINKSDAIRTYCKEV